jgi:hypothetical protein
MKPESRNNGERVFIARQRLDKEVRVKMNTQETIEKLPFLCNGKVNTPLQQRNCLETVIWVGGWPEAI